MNSLRAAFSSLVSQFQLFLKWWWSELIELVPDSWRQKLHKGPARNRIRLDQHGVTLAGQEDGVDVMPLNEQLDRLTRTGVQSLDVVFAGDFVLTHHFNLRVESLNQVEAAVPFQVDQQFPLRADVLYYGYAAEKMNDGVGFEVTVGACQRDDVNQEMQRISDAGLKVRQSYVELDEERTAVLSGWKPPFSLLSRQNALVSAVIAASVFLIFSWWQHRLNIIDVMEAELADLRLVAVNVPDQRNTLAFLEARYGLLRQEHQYPFAYEILNDLAQRRPGPVEITHLTFDENGVDLKTINNIEPLRTALQESPLYDPASFSGARENGISVTFTPRFGGS